MRQVFKAGATSQFVLHGNVFDLVPAPDGKGGVDFVVADRLPDRDDVPAVRRRHPLRPRPGRADRAARTRRRGRDAVQGRRGGPPLPEGRRRVPRRPRRVRRGGGQGSRSSTCATSCRATRSARSRSSTASSPSRASARRSQDGKVVAAPAQGRGDPRLRAVHRPAGRPHLRRRPQPDPHPDPGLGGQPRGHERLRGDGADHGEPRRPQPQPGREPRTARRSASRCPTADEIHAFVVDLVPDAAEFAKASEVTREVLADKLVGLSRVSVRTLVQARAARAASGSPAPTSRG